MCFDNNWEQTLSPEFIFPRILGKHFLSNFAEQSLFFSKKSISPFPHQYQLVGPIYTCFLNHQGVSALYL